MMMVRKLGHIKSKIINFFYTFQNRAIILAYHRIFSANADPQLLCVSPEVFEEQIKFLKNNYNILSLQELVSCSINNCIPNKSIVLTFDDGYVDNFLYLKPILEKYKVPATIFVTTNYIDKDKELWWDELEKLLLLPEKVSAKLILNINKKKYVWDLGDDSKYKSLKFGWNVTKGDLSCKRFKAYLDLHKLLRLLNFEDRENVLQDLRNILAVNDKSRLGYRVMNSAELKEISKSEFVEIGSHGIFHTTLSSQYFEEKRKEVFESKRLLENIISKDVLSFSYPFGGLNDIGKDLEILIEEAGYDVAVANYFGWVKKDVNRYILPRYIVRNWDEMEFANNLKKWFSGQ